MKQILKKISSVGMQSLVISIVVIFIVCPLSCHISAEGVEFITGDYIAPKLLNFNVIDGRNVELIFSEDVNVTELVVNDNTLLPISTVKNGSRAGQIIVELGGTASIGEEYIMGGVVEDKVGNSLTFSIPFVGYNSSVAKVIITEFMHETIKISGKSSNYKNEYLKLLVLEDGNLFGLVIGSGSWKNKDVFYLPSIDVKKGEEVILHFTNKGIGCISETEDNLDLATESLAKDGVRDLWLDNNKSVFGNMYDVVYIKNIQNKKIIDGFTYAHSDKTQWSEELAKTAKLMVEEGVFNSDLIEDACCIDKVSPTNPLIRLDVENIQNRIISNEYIELPIKTNKNCWRTLKSMK